MLILTRRPGEHIEIGNQIEITILKVQGNRVTIGVDAPDEVKILRGELEVEGGESNEREAA